MDFIVSLAHFCEIHGPTTVLCTQLTPLTCDTCYPQPTPPLSSECHSPHGFPGGFWEQSPAVTPNTGTLLFSPFTSPPTSPKSPNSTFNPYFGNFPQDKDHGRRFSFGSESESDTCDNCNLIVPKDMQDPTSHESPGGSSTSSGSHRSANTPVLRSTQHIAAYSLTSGSNDLDEEEDTDDESPSGSVATPRSGSVLGTSPTPSQTSTLGSNSHRNVLTPSSKHIHHLQYVTRRQPDSQSIYSKLRHSCIRALSCENLPRGQGSGSLLFGDPVAGHTIAYIFRLPDPRARGRRRTYALTASAQDCTRVMAAFVPVVKAFETIAAEIISLTDQVLERESIVSSQSTGDLLRTPPLSASVPTGVSGSSSVSPPAERSKSHTNSPVQRNMSDVSSFLSAKKVDSGGYPRMSREVMRAKGLPEIVGKENFFVELHAHFSLILSTLVNILP